eukprot:Tamp_12477.p1 GENE.Tamp_12477~~Tamp_12477.p1  ORF type:complete len:525 (+),score=24.13 Tamp_12477:3-1577(+)
MLSPPPSFRACLPLDGGPRVPAAGLQRTQRPLSLSALRGGADGAPRSLQRPHQHRTPCKADRRWQRPASLAATKADGGAGNGGADSTGGAELRARRPWGLLAILLAVYVHNQWCRNALQYSVNFAVTPSPEAAREFVNIALDVSKGEYAMLVSYAFICLYALFSLVSGRVADTQSRPRTLSLAAALWSTAVIAQATVCGGFRGLFVCRLVQGFTMAFTGPQCLSLLAQSFPKSSVATATSIYTSGVYIGSALASVSILQNKMFGWRAAYIMRGVIGIVLALGVAAFVPEPRDGQIPSSKTLANAEPTKSSWAEAKKALDGCSQVLRSPAVRLLLLATALRFCAGFGIGTWAAPLLRANFLEHQGEFARINALIILVGGCTSSILGGILADKLARVDPRARLWVPALGCFLAIPLICGTVFANTFHTAMVLFFLHFIIAECWLGPTLSTLSLLVPPRIQGASQGLFAVTTIIGNITPLLIRVMNETNTLAWSLSVCVGGAYALSGALFIAAARAAQSQGWAPVHD